MRKSFFLREKIGENHSYVMCFIMKKILTIKNQLEKREKEPAPQFFLRNFVKHQINGISLLTSIKRRTGSERFMRLRIELWKENSVFSIFFLGINTLNI